MLIVSIPKSASTALMETLAAAHNLACDMHYKWQGAPCAEFPHFHIQHPAFAKEIGSEDVDVFTRADMFFKVHVLPSENNLRLLRDKRKIILLRDAAGVIGAYRRGQQTGVYLQKTKAFDGCETIEDWVTRAKQIGLYQDLARFSERWCQDGGEHLVVYYDALIARPAEEIARIEAYMSLPLSGTSELLKRKYTRAGDASLAEHLATVDSWKGVGRG